MKETELAKIVQRWLIDSGWDVYPEAQMAYGRGRADLAAQKDGQLIIAEAKTNMSMRLLEQGDRWVRTKAVSQVYLAVPERKMSRFIVDVCRWRGFGLLLVHRPKASVRVMVKPADQKPSPKKLATMIDSLHPDMKRYQPGTVTGFSTPYNRTMNRVETFVIDNPGAFVTEVVDSIEHHYASRKSACQSMVKAIRAFEQGRLKAVKRNGRFRIYPVIQTG